MADFLKPGDSICLEGDLGAGKTTLARFIIESLIGKADLAIPSPTFTIINAYDSPKGPLWHCDFYRLNTEDEAEELGLDEGFNKAICLIEWPQKLGYLYPENCLQITLNILNDDSRLVTLQQKGKLSHDFSDIASWFIKLPE